VDAAALKSAFPVLGRCAYLNAGTCGPLPAAAVQAATAQLELELEQGRAGAHFERRGELAAAQRAAYAALLGGDPADVALTSSTSEGLATALAGLGLRRGDEILTSEAEHPGLQGPLIAARERLGITVVEAPFAELADAVGTRTRAVACSHVSWITGDLAPAALAELAIPVILDGAQAVGAVPVDVRALGCAAYAGSGQKWLCGLEGTGMLYVAPAWRRRIAATSPSYLSFADPSLGLDAVFHPDARRYDAPALPAAAAAAAIASCELLGAFGWAALHERARALAALLRERLAERGHELVGSGGGTLVSWRAEDPLAARDRLAQAGVVIRDLPGRGLLRASVGAWNDEQDLERLVEGLG